MSNKRRAAKRALLAYVIESGPGEMSEPRDWQASDMITDLLHTFTPEDAEDILRRVRRDYDAERD